MLNNMPNPFNKNITILMCENVSLANNLSPGYFRMLVLKSLGNMVGGFSQCRI